MKSELDTIETVFRHFIVNVNESHPDLDLLAEHCCLMVLYAVTANILVMTTLKLFCVHKDLKCCKTI